MRSPQDALPFEAEALAGYQEILKKTGILSCRVVSDSMAPLLKVGDFVQIEAIPDPEKLRPFDILVFLLGDRLFCHYFWTLNRLEAVPTISTRSLKIIDSNDFPVPVDQILGRVVGRRIPLLTRVRIIVWNLLHRRA